MDTEVNTGRNWLFRETKVAAELFENRLKRDAGILDDVTRKQERPEESKPDQFQ